MADMAPSADSAPTTQGQLRWVDVAKGGAIVLVALWHVTLKHYQQIPWQTTLPMTGIWGSFGEFFLPLRMPLFFTVSGMLAVSALSRKGRLGVGRKVGTYLYLYAVWLIIHTVALHWSLNFDTAIARTPGEFLSQLLISPTNLWYLFALGLYFLVAWLTKSVPAPVMIFIALVLSATASTGLIPDENNRVQVLQNLVFFVAGSRFRPEIEAFARMMTWKRFVLMGLAYGVVFTLVETTDTFAAFGVRPLLAGWAAAFGIGLAAHLCAVCRPIADVLGRLGRSTLPIYVMHLPMLALLDHGMRPLLTSLTGVAAWVVATIEPVVLTVLLVAGCLMMRRLLRLVRMDWLFSLPGSSSVLEKRRTSPGRGDSH